MKCLQPIAIIPLLATIVLLFTFTHAYGFTDFEKQQMYKKGENLFSVGKYHEALAVYQKILDDDPGFSDAVGAKAAVFHRWGDYETAIKYYDIAISLNPANPFFLSDKGSALLSLGDDISAENSLKKSLLLHPGFIDALNGLANVYSYRQDYQNELRYRQAVLVLDSQNTEAIVGAGNAFFGLGQYDDSIRQYDAALLIDPNNINAMNGLGNISLEMDDYLSALNSYNMALALDPQNHNAMHGSSLAHLYMGDLDKSIELDQQLKRTEQSKSNLANQTIPNWVKNIFIWYGQDQISEDEVLHAIQYLLEENFIVLNQNLS